MMDILPIGSDIYELISIITSKVAITIKGKASHPKSNVEETQKLSIIKIVSTEVNYKALILNELFCDTQKDKIQTYNIMPLFYEQRDYEIIIEYKDGQAEFWHENINVRNKVTESGKYNPRLSGIINFRNDIGYSDLIILFNGKQHIKITIEIFPSKLSYQKDYKLLLQDVTDEVYNLAYDFLKKTYQQADLVNKNGNSSSEFLSIINLIFDKMLRAVDIVIAHPYHNLQSISEVVSAHKIKNVNNKTIKWINANPHAVKKSNSGILIIEKAMTTKKFISFDTQENRFVKFVMNATIKKLKYLKSRYHEATSYNKERDLALITHIEKMQSELTKRIDFTFLKNVGTFSTNHSMSLVFAMAPGYKEVYRYFLMLQKGLSLHGTIFNISIKELSQLYEYWCFIKLNSMLKDRYRLIKQDILKTDKSGLNVTLKKGQISKVEYENEKNGERISLSYNQGYKGDSHNLPTVSQKPDNVLSLSKDKGKYEYIFDAKYRINMADKGSDYYKRISESPGPEESDINTMHRYRDAIVHQNQKLDKYERTMFGAYVLFPYHDEEIYRDHRFYKSIELVNVGGLPFLPGSTKLVEDFLDELIIDSAESAFERATLPSGIEEKLAHVDLNVRDVMVVLFRSVDQFDICFKNKIYYIPEKFVSDLKFPIRYLALYQSQNLFGLDAGIMYYGEVKRAKKVRRCEITEVPLSNSNKANELYYYFEIVKWIKLETKIEISGMMRRVNYYTNILLLQNCKSSSELSLVSLDQLRLYNELKRLSQNVLIKEEGEGISGFEFNGSSISIIGDELHVHTYDGKQKNYLVSHFSKKTKTVFNEIKREVGCL